MNRRARPVGYQSSRDYVAVNFASRSMRYTGVIILFYLIFHLLDLSWTGTGRTFVRGEVHDNMIASMQPPVGRAGLHDRQHRAAPSTCSTAPGRCSRAWGSTTPATTVAAGSSPSAWR